MNKRYEMGSGMRFLVFDARDSLAERVRAIVADLAISPLEIKVATTVGEVASIIEGEGYSLFIADELSYAPGSTIGKIVSLNGNAISVSEKDDDLAIRRKITAAAKCICSCGI
ncbi:MAG: hypothetical protein QG620_633 [Patescibacteria group bacterium]|nr:hypothetical protein [Patescibacteria group bacterium]